MVEKGPNQQSGRLVIFPFDYPIYDQLEKIGKIEVSLQPMSPLYYFGYPISEGNSSNLFNLFIRFNQNRSWEMNIMNDLEIIFMM